MAVDQGWFAVLLPLLVLIRGAGGLAGQLVRGICALIPMVYVG